MKKKTNKNNVYRKLAVIGVVCISLGIWLGAGLQAAPKNNPYLWNSNGKGVVLDGYDVVAYFTKKRALKGNVKYQKKYKSGTFYFSSATNLESFEKEPEKYIPQYGGNCAYATWKNGLTKADPRIFKVRNGKLFLNYNRSVEVAFFRSYKESRPKADKNWPGIVAAEK